MKFSLARSTTKATQLSLAPKIILAASGRTNDSSARWRRKKAKRNNSEADMGLSFASNVFFASNLDLYSLAPFSARDD